MANGTQEPIARIIAVRVAVSSSLLFSKRNDTVTNTGAQTASPIHIVDIKGYVLKGMSKISENMNVHIIPAGIITTAVRMFIHLFIFCASVNSSATTEANIIPRKI